MKRHGSIYIITNLINGKKYVGQTIFNVETRWASHINRYNQDSAISKAIHKYGVNNFSFDEVLTCFDQTALDNAEKYFISYYNTTGRNGYNKTFGGRKMTFTPEIRKKMSEKKKGNTIRADYLKANQSGSNNLKKLLHAQRLEGETVILTEYNPSTSPQHPLIQSKYELQKEEILRLYNITNSSHKVAKILDLDHSNIQRWLKKWDKLNTKSYSAKIRQKNRHTLDINFVIQCKNLYSEVKNYSEVSRILGISRKTVTRAIKDEKIVRPYEKS